MHGTEAGAGIEHAVTLRHEGGEVGRAVFVDTRWYAEREGDERELIGQEQWRFIEAQMDHALPLTIVCSGMSQRGKPDEGWQAWPRDWQRWRQRFGARRALVLSGDLHRTAFVEPEDGLAHFEFVASGASIKNFPWAREKRNYGVVDWNPQHTEVWLVERREARCWRIDNGTFAFERTD
jgi:hypothetical protein